MVRFFTWTLAESSKKNTASASSRPRSGPLLLVFPRRVRLFLLSLGDHHGPASVLGGRLGMPRLDAVEPGRQGTRPKSFCRAQESAPVLDNFEAGASSRLGWVIFLDFCSPTSHELKVSGHQPWLRCLAGDTEYPFFVAMAFCPLPISPPRPDHTSEEFSPGFRDHRTVETASRRWRGPDSPLAPTTLLANRNKICVRPGRSSRPPPADPSSRRRGGGGWGVVGGGGGASLLLSSAGVWAGQL